MHLREFMHASFSLRKPFMKAAWIPVEISIGSFRLLFEHLHSEGMEIFIHKPKERPQIAMMEKRASLLAKLNCNLFRRLRRSSHNQLYHENWRSKIIKTARNSKY
jgi:hypothetical protein